MLPRSEEKKKKKKKKKKEKKLRNLKLTWEGVFFHQSL